MNYKLREFIKAEQVKNNYSLYKNNDLNLDFDIPVEYKPKSQTIFKISYFLIPIDAEVLKISSLDEDFFNKNIYIEFDNNVYVPFFLHPTSTFIFKNWIGDKYIYIDSKDSIFEATPTSSYRSLLIHNIKKDSYFIAKVSIFGNVANGLGKLIGLLRKGNFSFLRVLIKP